MQSGLSAIGSRAEQPLQLLLCSFLCGWHKHHIFFLLGITKLRGFKAEIGSYSINWCESIVAGIQIIGEIRRKFELSRQHNSSISKIHPKV